MDIFTSFPNAIVSDVWEIGLLERSTEVGKTYSPLYLLDCIVDEIATGSQNNSPDADYIGTQTLLYVKPDVMEMINPAALIGNFLVKNTETGQLYKIITVGVGKNQETVDIEHYELTLDPTEVINE